VSTERGLDPRDYVVVSFGGAGPLHAGRIAEELGLSTIIVPRNAGVLSAYGLIAADFTQFETATRRIPLDERAPDAVREILGALQRRMRTRFSEAGISGEPAFTQMLQMRFAGQAFELDVPVATDKLATLTAEDLRAAFQDIHHQVYFHAGGSRSSKQIDIVGFHVGASAPAASSDLPIPVRTGMPSSREQTIHEYRERRICRQIERDAVGSGATLPGPSLISDLTTTIYVPPKWRAASDAAGNLIMRREP
jgi:N-methylhydantoinase A